MRHRTVLAFGGIGALVAPLIFGIALRSEAAPEVQVFRSATCGCCVAWARHMERSGFRVQVTDVEDLADLKRELGIPPRLGACHTARVDGFLVEGHVPAEDVWRLLRERPDVRGLGVPGMPEGSPGMEGPRPEAYTVFAFSEGGAVEPFARHGP